MEKIKTALKAINILKNWPVYFADYFKIFRKSHIFFKLKNGLVFKLRSGNNDRVIFNQIWLTKTYTPAGFEIADTDLVIDIGGHIGLFSILAGKLALKGRVYVFEPAEENFKFLQENINLNRLENIELIKKAVAKESGIREFALSPDDPAGHALLYEETNREKINVPTISLDDFVKENNIKKIDFLKMDCEGAEYEIFYNCSKKTLNMIQKISMEYHDFDSERTAAHIKSFLEINGFKVAIKTVGDNMLYAKR